MSMPQDPRRVLVVRWDLLGDAVLGLPLIAAMRRAWPGARIELLARPDVVALLGNDPVLDRAVAYDLEPTLAMGPLRSHLRLAAFVCRHWPPGTLDLLVVPRPDPFDTLHPALVGWWTLARRRIACRAYVACARTTADQALPGAMHRRLRRLAFTDIVPTGDIGCHESAHGAGLAAWLGLPATDPPRLHPGRAATEAAVRLIPPPTPDRRAWIALAAGARHPRRRWGVERFVAIAHRLLDLGCGVVFLGGGSEEQEHIPVRPGVLNGHGLPLATVAAVIARCQAFVGNDSGLGHVAAAVGCPPVIISCHPLGGDPRHYNSPERFAPLHPQAIVLRPPPAAPACAAGCIALSSPCCIRGVGEAEVMDAVLRLLEIER
jgi:heptosyltransferase-2